MARDGRSRVDGATRPRVARAIFSGAIALSALLATFAEPAEAAGEPRRPNVVVILADDLGYGDVHALNYRSRIPTPSLDRLASEGVTFLDAHTPSAVCSPTRYGLLTGRYAWRTRLKSGVLWGASPHLIDPERRTIADTLKERGYRTGVVGKWHLGLDWQLQESGDGPWKLVLGNGSGGRERPAGKPFGKPYQLFDLSADIREAKDRAAERPEVVERLTARLEELRESGRSKSLGR